MSQKQEQKQTKKLKKTHIDKIDEADNTAKILGDLFAETEARLKHLSQTYLEYGLTLAPEDYRRLQNLRLKAFSKEVNKVIKEESKKLILSASNASKAIDLTDKQDKKLKQNIQDCLQILNKNVIINHRKIVAQSGVTDDLHKLIADKLLDDKSYGMVQYSNGRLVRWENWAEMKLRTDIQNDIADNMVRAGGKNGVIFYICSFYGDCAPDHADFQGKIYCDEKWRSICPKEQLEDVSAYIRNNRIMTVQDVMSKKGNYLTTRPNCRHYFQYISINEVLNINSNKELVNKRESLNLNFNGKFKKEKYEALSQQRTNERSIRKLRDKIATLEEFKRELPEGTDTTNIDKNLARFKNRLNVVYKKQRELIKDNKGVLQRNYDREIYSKIISDFRINGK